MYKLLKVLWGDVPEGGRKRPLSGDKAPVQFATPHLQTPTTVPPTHAHGTSYRKAPNTAIEKNSLNNVKLLNTGVLMAIAIRS